MRGHGQKLTRKQGAAITALLTHETVTEAAQACGVAESTLFRWLQLSEFQSLFRAARRSLVESAIAQLQRKCTNAAQVLSEIAEDKEAPASSRVSAARAILEQSISAIQLTDLQEQIDEIKRMMSEQEGGPGQLKSA